MQVKNFVILLSSVVLLYSCKGRSLFGGKKHDKSEVTGWNYNDKNMGGYQVAKTQEQASGPGL
ncbi:MAG TPA: gliding motility lipoprotein GldJ, partial [Chitinophagaceae bacterium]